MQHERFHYNSIDELADTIDNMKLNIPLSNNISVLAKPLKINRKKVPNSMAVHPMEGCDGTSEGKPGELTYRRYKRFAAGGAGILWFEATAVIHEGRANPRQLLISESNAKNLHNLLKSALFEFGVRYGSKHKPYTVLQLTHSGRYSRPERQQRPLIASGNPYLDKKYSNNIIRHIVTDKKLEELEENYVSAAIIAQQIGFDAVDIKSCHGYLISELLSSAARTGQYGGNFENRTRFLVNIFDKIRTRTSNTIDLALRLNAYDAVPYPYGWGVNRRDYRNFDLKEPKKLVKLLHKKGLKLLNISAGNPYYNPHIGRPYDTGPYIPEEHPLCGVERLLNLCREIQQSVPTVPVVATGFSWLREFGAQCAAGAVENGWCKLAGFGRQAFAYPDFADDILKKGGMDRNKCCIACGKCSEIMRFDGRTGCVIRDSSAYLPIYKEVSKGKPSFIGKYIANHV
ncbi:MAG: flavin oxidoreductase/NADH oxidase [Candidatus Latescibacteria bacterium]|nr:flavin oxidoreductase/NADH oxidase [Candidatus Latescibacterota bacterium]